MAWVTSPAELPTLRTTTKIKYGVPIFCAFESGYMNPVATLTFPVLAFTPVGVRPYSLYESLLRVMKHEYALGWYNDLEIVDSNGVCVVVRSARLVKVPIIAKLFGGMVEVEIQDAEKLAEYDLDSMRSRAIEFLSLYPGMYQASGYEELVKRVDKAATSADIVSVFLT
ncbi:hypothetical protein [Aeoliella sp. SH292]|uniref:hypothetical protein n=1 Tax=Aeoliella sp. SH292 TaxID=3454464 RepID=UPI003F95C73C